MVYGVHPRLVVAHSRGRWNRAGSDKDPYTGKTIEAMHNRYDAILSEERMLSVNRQRAHTLNDALRHGAHWERSPPLLLLSLLQCKLTATHMIN